MIPIISSNIWVDSDWIRILHIKWKFYQLSLEYLATAYPRDLGYNYGCQCHAPYFAGSSSSMWTYYTSPSFFVFWVDPCHQLCHVSYLHGNHKGKIMTVLYSNSPCIRNSFRKFIQNWVTSKTNPSCHFIIWAPLYRSPRNPTNLSHAGSLTDLLRKEVLSQSTHRVRKVIQRTTVSLLLILRLSLTPYSDDKTVAWTTFLFLNYSKAVPGRQFSLGKGVQCYIKGSAQDCGNSSA